MSNVLPFRSYSVARTDADKQTDSASFEGNVIRGWPAALKPWMTPAVQALRPSPDTLSPTRDTQLADNPVPPLRDPIQAIAARQIVPRDISDDLKALPPLDVVEPALLSLVPASCLSFSGDFWTRDHASKKGISRIQKSRVQQTTPGIVPTEQRPEDAEAFAAMRGLDQYRLKEQYPEIHEMTYSSWKNMKSRCKKEGSPVHSRFDDFGNFLDEVGPRLRPEYTLDRVKPGELGGLYEPGNVRWLDKKGQANNRSSTRMLTAFGEYQSVSVLAEQYGQKRNTVLNRIDRQGWSVEEALTGKRGGNDQRPWDHHKDDKQREAAEQFYLGHRRPGEIPFEFCIRKFAEGMGPWAEYLEVCGFYLAEEEAPTAGIAAHCLAELQRAQNTLQRFSPTGRWLGHIGAELKATLKAAEKADKAKRARRGFRPTENRRRRDREAEHLNELESNPELAYPDDDMPW
ncbi:hypothetical protein [Mesorhizobium sp. ES1-4]|uniref:hypothetical protein n=1 Tax=Mesorhizobium sp. ES1-4 TaxID=2876627 RepID=UPI001CC9D942|nr:hypothetical protein [Mesorhizobium sp. ES1-4]MBZ9798805.1 hypothetical protein [Mesorhizobium sp. ES1-4]